jgi:hypothetical protein
MSDIQEQIFFEGSGLNWDDDRRYFKIKGDSEYRLNILVGEDGSSGIITNSLGNHVVTYQLGNANTYFTIGSCYDELNRCVYYWVFSQPYDITGSDDYTYDNRLLRFNEESETIDTIFLDPKNYFGLHPSYLMRDPFILGDWLYFNSRVSEPKMIDVVRAYNYTTFHAYDIYLSYVYGDKVTYYGGLFLANQTIDPGETPVTDTDKWDRIGDSYQNETILNFDSEFRYAFNVLHQPPIHMPVCVYDYDENKEANNVKNVVFRFSYRYKYFDNSFSVYSAYSDVTLPDGTEYYNGEVPGNVTLHNFIQVNITLGSPSLIKEIEIVFQEVGAKDWKRAKVINRQDIELITESNYVYNFYNDESYLVVVNTEVTKISDSVPRIAECQELINKNILAYAYCKEGFNNLDKNDLVVSLTPELENYNLPDSLFTLKRNNLNILQTWPNLPDIWINTEVMYTGYWWTHLSFDSWYASANIQQGDIYRVKIGDSEYFYTIQLLDIANIDSFVLAIRAFLAISFPQYTWMASLTAHTISGGALTKVIFKISTFYTSAFGNADLALYKKHGFKTGAWHPFCLFYYDESLRRWDAQTTKENVDGINLYEIDGTTVYVPMFNEVSPNPGTTNYRWIINWEVNHLPPAGAKYWRWGYAGNSLCGIASVAREFCFVQYIISAIVDEGIDPPDSTRITITPLQTLKTAVAGWNQFPNSIIDPYIWEKGDRVRFITEASVGGNIGNLVDGVYDFEIIKFTDASDFIYIQRFAWGAAGIDTDSLIEIYRPLKGDTEIQYYEFGELYPIIEDTLGVLVHAGGTGNQNTDLLTPATGVFDSGDVYHILRTPSKPINTTDGYFHESQWYSDFFDSDDWGKGKIGIETTFNERYLNIIRFSYPYFQNTQINGLSTFDGLRYKELNDVYGKILRIIEIGDTLKVYQRKKPSSIGIGRTEYMDANGNITVVGSDQVLGIVRYSSTNYGTEFPESISRNNRYVYGFDVYNGVFWRDAANGIFPISGRYVSTEGSGDYKMDSYFKQKAKALLTSGIDHCDVMTVWDERYKNLFVTFKDYVDEKNNETIVFHEPSNRWICFTEFDQTLIEGWNQILELTYDIVQGFEGGLGYEFDEDTRFAIFNLVHTGATKRTIMDELGLTIVATSPTISAGGSKTETEAPLTIVAASPTVEVYEVHSTVSAFTFTCDEGFTNVVGLYQATTITCSASILAWQVKSKPWWIKFAVYSGSAPTGALINHPDQYGDNTELRLAVEPNYATTILNGEIVLGDDTHDLCTLTVTQATGPATYEYEVIDGLGWLVFKQNTTHSGTVIAYSFMPEYLGSDIYLYDVDMQIMRNGVEIIILHLHMKEMTYTSGTVDVGVNSIAGDRWVFRLSQISIVPVSGSTIVDEGGLTIVATTPLVGVYMVTPSVITMNFAYNDTVWQSSVITTSSDVFIWKIWGIDSWLGYKVFNTGGIDQTEHPNLWDNLWTLKLLPNTNTGMARTGHVILGDSTHALVTITINQTAYVIPPTISIFVGAGDEWTFNGGGGSITVGSDHLTFYLNPENLPLPSGMLTDIVIKDLNAIPVYTGTCYLRMGWPPNPSELTSSLNGKIAVINRNAVSGDQFNITLTLR